MGPESSKIVRVLVEDFLHKKHRFYIDVTLPMSTNCLQAMTGTGGWPLNVWLTPDLKPFVGATYFPPEDKPGRPAFKTILNHIIKQVCKLSASFTIMCSN